MSFDRLRDPGFWTFDSVVQPAEFEAFDENLSHAIDGLDGGSYSLRHSLIIGATGTAFVEFDCLTTFTDRVVVNTLEVAGTGTFGGDATFLGNTTIGQDENTIFTLNSYTTFNGIAGFYNDVLFAYGTHFYGNAQFEADVSLNSPGNTLTVAGDIDVGNGIDVQGFGTFRSALSCEGVFTAYAGSSLNGTTTCQGALVVQGVTTLNGVANLAAPWGSVAGGMCVARIATGANANASYGPKNWDIVTIPPTIVGPLNYTIDDTGAVDGVPLRFISRCPTSFVNIKNPGGTTLAQIQNQNGQVTDVTLVRRAGQWEVMSEVFHP